VPVINHKCFIRCDYPFQFPPFHDGNTGSNPVRVDNRCTSIKLRRRSSTRALRRAVSFSVRSSLSAVLVSFLSGFEMAPISPLLPGPSPLALVLENGFHFARRSSYANPRQENPQACLRRAGCDLFIRLWLDKFLILTLPQTTSITRTGKCSLCLISV
jgi:hypothetical protein